jgi:hypothetical protein
MTAGTERVPGDLRKRNDDDAYVITTLSRRDKHFGAIVSNVSSTEGMHMTPGFVAKEPLLPALRCWLAPAPSVDADPAILPFKSSPMTGRRSSLALSFLTARGRLRVERTAVEHLRHHLHVGRSEEPEVARVGGERHRCAGPAVPAKSFHTASTAKRPACKQRRELLGTQNPDGTEADEASPWRVGSSAYRGDVVRGPGIAEGPQRDRAARVPSVLQSAGRKSSTVEARK